MHLGTSLLFLVEVFAEYLIVRTLVCHLEADYKIEIVSFYCIAVKIGYMNYVFEDSLGF